MSRTQTIIAIIATARIKTQGGGLPAMTAEDAAGAGGQALYGSLLCLYCLADVSTGLHDNACHVLGGAFNLPHAETLLQCCPLPPPYNARSALDAMPALRGRSECRTPQAACRISAAAWRAFLA
ncbi:hypothetical protein [Rhizobium leguminosarum]|uniref:hypothetical protein n=1 Tax=Rhizobium leguminosarum TaxID=384 RepID=UPI000326A736|nr:hypothetical protein [Rhizobium leguminosarum]